MTRAQILLVCARCGNSMSGEWWIPVRSLRRLCAAGCPWDAVVMG